MKAERACLSAVPASKVRMPAGFLARGYGLLLDPPIAPELDGLHVPAAPRTPVMEWDISVLEGLRVRLSADGAKDAEIIQALECLLRFVEINLWRLKKRLHQVWGRRYLFAHANIAELFVRAHAVTGDVRFLNVALKLRDVRGMRLTPIYLLMARDEVPVIQLCWRCVNARLNTADICRLI